MFHRLNVLIFVLCVIHFCAPRYCRAQEAGSPEALRAAARRAAGSDPATEAEESAFTSGALGLQRLNPEISVTGDILWSYTDNTEDADSYSDFLFRGLGLHFEAYLDPFTKFKAAASLGEHDSHLGEAYMTRFGILPHVNVTLGKFHQQFGIVNRWHKHGLDQIDFPMPLRMIFGDGGLNQTGASIDWTMPTVAGFSHELTAQFTDAENPRVFGENSDRQPAGLAHYKLYRDLTDSTYAELGLTGLIGRNNEWTVADGTLDEEQNVSVFGADFTVMWEPTEKMRYRNFTWRTEAYALDKEILAPDGSGEDNIQAWGAYTYIESKVSRTLILGVRGDYFEPDVKPWTESEVALFSPVAVTENDAYRWQVAPYITWYQSPFVHFRVEYDHSDGEGTGPEERRVWLQCIFAAGPHKHERY